MYYNIYNKKRLMDYFFHSQVDADAAINMVSFAYFHKVSCPNCLTVCFCKDKSNICLDYVE